MPAPPSTGFTEKHISFCVSSLKTLSYTGIFPRETHPSTPPFSSCFKISEKAEQQKTKHNIQLKQLEVSKCQIQQGNWYICNSLEITGTVGMLLFAIFHMWQNTLEIFYKSFLVLEPIYKEGGWALVLGLPAHFFFLYTTCLQGR